MAHSLPSRAVEAPVVDLEHYNQHLKSFKNLQKLESLSKPNANPAMFQKGKSAVGRTLLSARISLNFWRCFFSWSHISWCTTGEVKQLNMCGKTQRISQSVCMVATDTNRVWRSLDYREVKQRPHVHVNCGWMNTWMRGPVLDRPSTAIWPA